MLRFFLSVVLFCAVGSFADDFSVNAQLLQKDNALVLEVKLGIPEKADIIRDSLEITLLNGGTAALAADSDKPVMQDDEWVFDKDSTLRYTLQGAKIPVKARIGYQGCLEKVCLMPQDKTFTLSLNQAGSVVEDQPTEVVSDSLPWNALAATFTEVGRETGYMNSSDFINWIQHSRSGNHPPEKNLLQRVIDKYGLLLAILLIIPLGLMLNLTPCVLPMIPINLSIIGAGAHSKSGRGRGGFLGGLYGLAMALVYGGVGAVVVKTGARFGVINSSAWFNWMIAVIFIVLALSMFDVFILDFSRFRHSKRKDARKSNVYITALVLGGISALLAGACVAPVLIWVLLLAADLQAKGNAFAIFLPLLLGVGMGLPWPILGAGISKIPKPGMWMVYIKKGMGVLILLFACYYIWIGIQIMRKPEIKMAGWENNLAATMEKAQQSKQLILVDFWGISCKSCMLMKKTTLKDQKVLGELENVLKVEFQSDDLDNPTIKQVLQYYKIAGLPTFLLLKNKPAKEN